MGMSLSSSDGADCRADCNSLGGHNRSTGTGRAVGNIWSTLGNSVNPCRVNCRCAVEGCNNSLQRCSGHHIHSLGGVCGDCLGSRGLSSHWVSASLGLGGGHRANGGAHSDSLGDHNTGTRSSRAIGNIRSAASDSVHSGSIDN